MVRPALPPPGSKQPKMVSEFEPEGEVKHPLLLEKKVMWCEWRHKSELKHSYKCNMAVCCCGFLYLQTFLDTVKFPGTHINCIKARKKKRQDRKEKRQTKNALINSAYNQSYGRHDK